MKSILLFLVLMASANAVEYTYNSAGQLLAESYPNGAHILYTYDAIGNLTERQSLAANASPSADLSITSVVSPSPPTAGTEVTITFTVTNNGPDPATDVGLTETLPASLAPVSIESSQGINSLNGQDITSNLGTLANGATATVTVVADVLDTTALNFTVDVTAPADGNAANNTATIGETPAGGIDLLTTIAAGPDPSLTDVAFIPFILTITNNGPSAATNVVHTFNLPSNLTFSFSDNAGSAHVAGVVTTNIASLAAGTSIQIIIGASSGSTPGNAPVAASVTADETDLEPSNNNDAADIDLITSTLVVTNTNDSGAGSLRQAILDANASSNADVIRFDIAGFTVPSLNPVTDLPAVTEPVTIDAFSAEAGVFEINGTGRTNCLVVNSSDVTLRGLVLNRATGVGLLLQAIGDDLERVEVFGCPVGVNANTNLAQGNGGDGIFLDDVDDAVIGGPAFWQFNVIAANGGDGIEIDSDSDRAVVQGNHIGLISGGTDGGFDEENNRHGINLLGRNALIGGAGAGERNFLSNNNLFGLKLLGRDNVIQGNVIGLGTDGSIRGNDEGGIQADGTDNVIGGIEPGEGNIISGQSTSDPGIDLGDEVRVIGNFLGLNLALNARATTSGSLGVVMRRDAVLGGVLPGEGNVISGHNGDGVRLDFNDGEDITIIGNKIGTDPTGTFSIPNDFGIRVEAFDLSPKVIGLPFTGAGNLISGNLFDGILLDPVFANPVEQASIQNNKIGTDIGGTLAIPNGRNGIRADGDNVRTNTIGGTVPMAGNVIAFNSNHGIDLERSESTKNTVLGNTIFGNGALGISLSGTTPLANDPGDTDDGATDGLANDGQNFPVVTVAESTGSITASLNSEASETFRIEFFSNTVCDPSGNGEGETFLGFAELTTDASGDGMVNFTADAQPEGAFVTATATDSDGNTSEFGVCFTVVAPSGFNDIDGDGMSNEYELEHFGSDTGGDPGVDSDGDGRSNLEEFIALTDPNSPTSFIDVQIRKRSEGGYIISVKTELGRTYQLQAVDDLGGFIDLGPALAGDGNTVEFIDATAGTRKYYRIQVNR
ncbi:MAG: hypothetical protein AAGA58_07395 [Verrucomicrobiota bacterium]